MNVLVVNAGSSSLKYQLINMSDESVLAKGIVERIGADGTVLKHTKGDSPKVEFLKEMEDHTVAFKFVVETLMSEEHGVISSMDEISAVGHRVVHGGEKYAGSVLITDDVISTISECSEFAPLHNPANLMGLMLPEKSCRMCRWLRFLTRPSTRRFLKKHLSTAYHMKRILK